MQKLAILQKTLPFNGSTKIYFKNCLASIFEPNRLASVKKNCDSSYIETFLVQNTVQSISEILNKCSHLKFYRNNFRKNCPQSPIISEIHHFLKGKKSFVIKFLAHRTMSNQFLSSRVLTQPSLIDKQ